MQARILTAAAMSSVLLFSTAGALDVDPAMEAKRLEAGLARLCGVWEWTVHSHTLNHREAKSKIVLPSADTAGIPDLRPLRSESMAMRSIFAGSIPVAIKRTVCC